MTTPAKRKPGRPKRSPGQTLASSTDPRARSRAAAELAALGSDKSGRPPVLAPCKYCGALLGTNARRVHEPLCRRGKL